GRHGVDRRAVLHRDDLPRAPAAAGDGVMSDGDPRLRAIDVTVRLGGTPVIEGACLDLRPAELTVLVGPNAAGKTTLMRALAGLISSQGRIEIGGRALSSLSARDRARQIAYLPQGHVFHWPMPVAAVVALGRYAHTDAFSALSAADHAAV